MRRRSSASKLVEARDQALAATFFEPHQHARGIEYVLVNGTRAVDKGQRTWERAGTV